VEIGKSAAVQAQELARLYGQNPETEAAGQSAVAQSPQTRSVAAGEGRATVMVEISAEAQERAQREESLAAAKAQYAQLPAGRAEVIAAVRQRLDEGFYASDAVKEALTDRLLPLARRLEVSGR